MQKLFKVASVEWYENPIIIRIDTVSRELTNEELFPTVVLCPKQTKSYVDEFGIVKVALELIEFTCNTSKESIPDKCDSYISISQKILDKATYSKILYLKENSLVHLLIYLLFLTGRWVKAYCIFQI